MRVVLRGRLQRVVAIDDRCESWRFRSVELPRIDIVSEVAVLGKYAELLAIMAPMCREFYILT